VTNAVTNVDDEFTWHGGDHEEDGVENAAGTSHNGGNKTEVTIPGSTNEMATFLSGNFLHRVQL